MASALEIGTTGAQYHPFLSSRQGACDFEQGRLADAGAGFDRHHAAHAHERLDLCQFGIPFDEGRHARR